MQAFFLIIIIWVAIEVIKSQVKSNVRDLSRQTGQPRQSQPKKQDRQSQPPAMMQKQQELKEKLQQRYDSSPNPVSQNDIMYRANESASAGKNNRDRIRDMEKLLLPEAVLEGCFGKSETAVLYGSIEGVSGLIPTSDLMREVNDLILMGYRSKLPFERDFVSEGIEMLNKYEIPVTEP